MAKMGAIRDMLTMRWANAHKLKTREDPLHIHKMLGVLAMSHFLYRWGLLVTHGTMGFDGSWGSLGCVAIHTLLSGTSLLFHIPHTRIRGAPMIYPEFRMHSIIFAYRSLFVMALHWARLRGYLALQELVAGKCAAVLLTLLSADITTRMLPQDNTTIRNMPYPAYIPVTGQKVLHLFYSVSQVFATMMVLQSTRMDHAFALLLPIQLAAFLMTCVRKSILTSGGWHLWYTLALLSNFVYGLQTPEAMSMEHSRWFIAGFCVMRFQFYIPKYPLWAVILGYYAYYMHCCYPGYHSSTASLH